MSRLTRKFRGWWQQQHMGRLGLSVSLAKPPIANHPQSDIVEPERFQYKANVRW